LKNEYLWKKSADDIVATMPSFMSRHEKMDSWGEIEENAVKAFNGYYGKYFKNGTVTAMGSAGSQGELLTVSANHYASLVRNVISVITQERIVFDVHTENNDIESRDVAAIGESVLNHYFYNKNYNAEYIKMLELGLISGTAYIELCWDSKYKLIGQDVDGEGAYVGRPTLKARHMFDVFVENPNNDDFDSQNVIVTREDVNRFDIAAQYPDLEEEILNLPRVNSAGTSRSMSMPSSDDNRVWLYKAYHRESPAMPNGRMIYFADNGLVLQDYGRNPYVDLQSSETPNRGIPIFCFRPSIRHGRHFGHTRGFDVLALQDNLNALTSTVATNQVTFGVQHIAVPRTAGIQASQIGGSTKMYEYDIDPETGKGLPEVLRLLETPQEIFRYIDSLVLQMETLMGVNSIMRGKVTTSIPPTGVAAALLTAQGQIANSDIEAAYYRVVESSAMFLLYMIARFQRSEDTINIVGKDKQRESKTFNGENLTAVNNVSASVGNPLARTTAGKIAILEVGMQNGMIKTPAQFMEVLQTGNLKQELEGGTAELNLIRWENEKLRNSSVEEGPVDQRTGQPTLEVKSAEGESILVAHTDNPRQHIVEHKVVMDDPHVRQNPKVLEAITRHIEQHLDQLDILQENYPQLLAIIFGEPLPMPQPSQGSGLAQAPENMDPMTKEQSSNLKKITGGNTAEAAAENGDAAVMSALKAAEGKVAAAAGEIA